MIRIAISLLMFSLLVSLQVSFIGSLPWPLSVLPLVGAVTVYMVQHRGLVSVAWWMPGYGLLLDLLGLSHVPLMTGALAASAGAVIYLSRVYFSNRSLYGVLACGACGWVVLGLTEGILLFSASLLRVTPFDWGGWVTSLFWEGLLGAIVLVLFFQTPVARR